jgi:hypothetical protein
VLRTWVRRAAQQNVDAVAQLVIGASTLDLPKKLPKFAKLSIIQA